ncbi:MAG: hypothetical protein HY064_14185 [Bacteroidetes bacterium]|nr:hypothetical protein [Bacteroidota bacterium]
MKKVLLLFLFAMWCGNIFAQGDMRFFGTATEGGKPLAGATVTVQMDGKQIINLTTGKNGKFKFTIDVGHSYQINYSAPGCVSMFMTMDLHTPPDKAWIYPDYVAEIPFFSSGDPKVKTELFAQKPFIKVVFDGNSGFHDDPTYRFIDEIFKDPNEELKKQQELAKKQAEEQARLDAEEKARKDEEERQRLQKEDDDRKKAEEEAKQKQHATDANANNNQPQEDAAPESDAVKLEKEKEEKLNREKQNKNIKAQYENNLLKLVAESERQNNLEKYNKMKEDAEGSSVVQVMRKEAEVKAQNDFLIEQDKERTKQTKANKQIKEEQMSALVRTEAQIEKDIRANQLKPVVLSSQLNYSPSPNIVVTTEDELLSTATSTVISWPGGKRTIFRTDEYLWGSKYYYHDGLEIDSKTYEAELFRHKRG